MSVFLPGGLQFLGSQRVRHDLATSLSLLFQIYIQEVDFYILPVLIFIFFFMVIFKKFLFCI